MKITRTSHERRSRGILKGIPRVIRRRIIGEISGTIPTKIPEGIHTETIGKKSTEIPVGIQRDIFRETQARIIRSLKKYFLEKYPEEFLEKFTE